MAINFKRNSKVYLVYSGSKYELDVLEDLEFSQTFTENSTSVKTLHSEDFFERATIVKANPANFSFTTPAIQQDDNKVAFDRLLDCNSFDLYIQSDADTFHLDNCVFTSGSFVIERSTELRITLSGQAEKLDRVGDGSYTIPGTNVARSSQRRYLRANIRSLVIGGTDIRPEVYSIAAELQNEVKWNGYTTVHDGIGVSSRTNAMFPSGFTVASKSFAGSIGRYLDGYESGRTLNFDTETTLRIRLGERISSQEYGFDFNMNKVAFTGRTTAEQVFTQHIDWRMTSNDTLTDRIKYLTTS